MRRKLCGTEHRTLRGVGDAITAVGAEEREAHGWLYQGGDSQGRAGLAKVRGSLQAEKTAFVG